MDTAMLLVRVTIGTLFVGHGAQHAFRWFGGYGADGTGRWLESFGFPPGRRFAMLLGGAEIVVGTLFGVGFLLPLAAAGIVAIALAAARTDHAGNGPWIWKNGWEYVLTLGVLGVSVVLAGPGAASVDQLLGLPLSGAGWAMTTALAGLASGSGVLRLRRPVATVARPDPTPAA